MLGSSLDRCHQNRVEDRDPWLALRLGNARVRDGSFMRTSGRSQILPGYLA